MTASPPIPIGHFPTRIYQHTAYQFTLNSHWTLTGLTSRTHVIVA